MSHVAATITPSPWFCDLMAAYSISTYCEMYCGEDEGEHCEAAEVEVRIYLTLTKGSSSGMPPETTIVCKKLREQDNDEHICYYTWQQSTHLKNCPLTMCALSRYDNDSSGKVSSKPHQCTKTAIRSSGGLMEPIASRPPASAATAIAVNDAI